MFRQVLPLPRSTRGLVFLSVLAGIAGTRLLGEQGASLGSFSFPSVGLRPLLGLSVLAFLLVPRSGRRPQLLQFVILVTGLIVTAWPLASWRASIIEPAASLPVAVSRVTEARTEVEVTRRKDSLTVENRQYLNRLAGRRRDVRLEIAGSLFAPRPGVYRFYLDCDNRCVLRLDGKRLARAVGFSRVETFLNEGVHRLTLRFEQVGGPARLLVGWDQPSFLAFLPLDHYVSADADQLTASKLRKKEIAAGVSFALSLTWWGALFAFLMAAGESREFWRETLSTDRGARWIPIAAATLLVGFGSILRFDALLVRSQLVEVSPWANTVHGGLRPFLPDYYAVYRANLEEDPYRADVRSYLDRAEAMSLGSFYDASFREPFYVGLVKLFVALAGAREVGILIQSLFFSIAVLPLAFMLAVPVVGRWWAAAMLVPLVLHEWLIFEAPSGYRMSAYVFFLILFAASVFGRYRGRSVLRGVVSGILAAIICLIRLSALSFVVPIFLLGAWEKRKQGGWSTLGVAVLTTVLLVTPFLVNCYRTHGDPFYAISFHTQFWLRAEGTESPASLGQVSLYRYVSEFHGIGELATGNLRGLTVLPLTKFWSGLSDFPLLDTAVLTAGVAGLLLSVATPLRFLLVAYLGHLIPFAYIQNFSSGRAPRFVMPAYFFLVLAAVWLGYFLVERRNSQETISSGQAKPPAGAGPIR